MVVFRGIIGVATLPAVSMASVSGVTSSNNTLLTSPNGSKIALKDLAQIEIKDGPAQISREYAKRRIVVAMNVKERDLGGFVAELQNNLEIYFVRI